jgi:hypothetical protein
MRPGSIVSFCPAVLLLLLSSSRPAFALERDGLFLLPEQSDAVQAQSPEFRPLPPQFTDAQTRALKDLPPAALPIPPHTPHKPFGFYRGAYNRPLTPREVSFRESVSDLAARHRQFVHVRLVDGRVFTGTIYFTSAEAFLIQTDLSRCHLVHYRQLAEPPRPVLALGTKSIRGLEIGGMVVACIAILPVALVVYPLIAAGVIQD